MTGISLFFLLLLPANATCDAVMEQCVIPRHVPWGCAEYATYSTYHGVALYISLLD